MYYVSFRLNVIMYFSAGWGEKCKHVSPEPCILDRLNISMNDLTPFGIDSWPRDILVWHTKTLVDVRTTKTYGYNVEVRIFYNNSNCVFSFRALLSNFKQHVFLSDLQQLNPIPKYYLPSGYK